MTDVTVTPSSSRTPLAVGGMSPSHHVIMNDNINKYEEEIVADLSGCGYDFECCG